MTFPEQLRSVVPIRFWFLAAACAAVVGAASQATRWVPWEYSTTVLSYGWGDAVHSFSVLVWSLAPLVALRWPVPIAVVACLPLVATATDDRATLPFAFFLSFVAMAMTATWARPRTGVALAAVGLLGATSWAAGLTVLLLPYGAELQESASWSGYLVTLLLYAVPTAACLGLAHWLRQSASADAREADLARRSRAVDERSAVLAERARLARDLHDVVAHHVSLIAVRAETAPYTVPDLPPAARATLAEVAADARLALDELRGVLGILGRADTDLELAPQPGLADVTGLVERAGSAGQVVELRGDLALPVPAAVGYAAYRVVQEALTNARRHAPGQPVLVSVDGGADTMSVSVTNRLGPDADDAPAGGHGLVGMRERVSALGGELTAGRRDGGYTVTAMLPVGSSRP